MVLEELLHTALITIAIYSLNDVYKLWNDCVYVHVCVCMCVCI